MTPTITQHASDEQIRTALADGGLGVLVTHVASAELLQDLLAAAAQAGVSITAFFMDEATELLRDKAWVARLPEGHFAACDVSCRARGVEPPERVVAAGQYHNAMMVHDVARMVSL